MFSQETGVSSLSQTELPAAMRAYIAGEGAFRKAGTLDMGYTRWFGTRAGRARLEARSRLVQNGDVPAADEPDVDANERMGPGGQGVQSSCPILLQPGPGFRRWRETQMTRNAEVVDCRDCWTSGTACISLSRRLWRAVIERASGCGPVKPRPACRRLNLDLLCLNRNSGTCSGF